VLEEDVVEDLHHLGLPEVPLEQAAAGERAGVELFDLPVALRVVVAGVEDRLAGQGLGRDLGEGLHRDADHDQVARLGGLSGRGRGGERAEFGDEFLQCLGTAGVAQDDPVPGGHAQPGHGAADHAAADDAYGCHERANPGSLLVIPGAAGAGRCSPSVASSVLLAQCC